MQLRQLRTENKILHSRLTQVETGNKNVSTFPLQEVWLELRMLGDSLLPPRNTPQVYNSKRDSYPLLCHLTL